LATYVSHNRVAQMARNTEITNYLKCVKWLLVTRCAIIMRIAICKPNFQIDLAKWCLLFNTWWKQNRYASAFLERIRWKNKYRIWTIFWFSTTNGVYTAADYVISCRN
jgi:hypothetical protein